MKQPKIFVKLNRDNIECYTPKYAVDIILEFIPKNKIIWAPFSKNEHNFADYLRQKGYKVINSHIDYGQDFFNFEPSETWDILLDNPPFKGKTKFVQRAISFKKPFALFLPFNSFGDNDIPRLFLENNLEPQLLIPIQRTQFLNQPKNGISFKTVYICDKILPKQIIFKKMEKKMNKIIINKCENCQTLKEKLITEIMTYFYCGKASKRFLEPYHEHCFPEKRIIIMLYQLYNEELEKILKALKKDHKEKLWKLLNPSNQFED